MRQQTELEVFVAAGRLATEVGFKWYMGTWPEFTPGLGHAADNVSDLCHEIAHFLTSPKWLRHKPNFGLGHPLSGSRHVSFEYSVVLEEESSILGTVMEYKCGSSLARVSTVACDHSWDVEDADAQVAISRLRKKGLWDADDADRWAAIVADFK